MRVVTTDPGFAKDIESWCRTNGHTLASLSREGNKHIAEIVKGSRSGGGTVATGESATLVLFSGDLDKALAAMVIAQGAAAQGKRVTVFFTFWGLNALRKAQAPPVSKTMVEKMFAWMMPQGAAKLSLSQMNMAGLGKAMIQGIMKEKNVDSLEVMMRKAMDLGVTFIACTMSMELMGIKKEELLDGIEYGGVGAYIAANENAGTTLFI